MDNSQDRLSKKILDTVLAEIGKADTQKRIKCVIDPMSYYLLKSIQPYVVGIISLMILILVCQGLLLFKLLSIKIPFLESFSRTPDLTLSDTITSVSL